MTTALPNNVSGFVRYGQYLADPTVSGGWFGPILLMTAFFVCVVLLRRKSQEQNLATSSLITLMAGVLMVVMQWISFIWVIAFFGLSVIMYFILRARNVPYP